MKESKFQKELKDEIRFLLPGCIISKNDPNDIQGFPDLTILFGKMWALLEVKKDKDAPYRPNQEYYLNLARKMGNFSATVYPENKQEVIHRLVNHFKDN